MKKINEHICVDELAADTYILEVHGKLYDEDYRQHINGLMESWEQKAKAAGKHEIKVMIITKDFHGWTAHAAWDDFMLGWRNRKSLAKLALVVNRAWEKHIAEWLGKPFAKLWGIPVKAFQWDEQAGHAAEQAEIDAAKHWLKG